MSISRRKFLGWMGAAGVGAIANKPADAEAHEHFEGYPDSMGVLHDISLCVGCRSCEEACNKENEMPAPDRPFTDLTVLDQKRRTTPFAHTVVNRYDNVSYRGKPVFVKTQCNHCLEPACAASCMVAAFSKRPSGAVTYDDTVCVGCRYCMIACPFEIPTYEYFENLTPLVQKCTMCAPRLEKGLMPACVEACPREALIFKKRSELIKIARERIRKYPDRYVDHIYGEHEMGGTGWLYLSPVPFKEVGLREDLGVATAQEMTHGCLGLVPMIVGLWPAFLLGMKGMSLRREKVAAKEKADAVANAVSEANTVSQGKYDKAMENANKQKDMALKMAQTKYEKEMKEALEKAAAPEPETEAETKTETKTEEGS